MSDCRETLPLPHGFCQTVKETERKIKQKNFPFRDASTGHCFM